MASILLPDSPGLSGAKIRLLDWGGRLVPQGGGVTQNLLRLGTRSGVEYKLPRMRSDPDGRVWGMKLREGKLSGVMVPFIQDGFRVGAPGMPVVDGAGQAGSVLAIRGLTPRYGVRYGQAFSLIHGGRRYIHFARVPGVADAAGKITLPIFPMLRVIPSASAILEFAKPMLEGSLTGNEVAWDIGLEPFADLGVIRIDEDA
jgi:hypothetical protein